MPQPVTPSTQPPKNHTPEERHRIRVMTAIRDFSNDLAKLAERLVFRFRSTEAAGAIQEYVESIGDIRTLAEARDILGEILESPSGSIKPLQLDTLIRAAMQSLFNAADRGDGMRWPTELMRMQSFVASMFDPYAATRLDLRELKLQGGTRGLFIELGPVVQLPLPPPQSPAASHSNSVARSSLPATSRRVTPSRSGKVQQPTGAQAMTA